MQRERLNILFIMSDQQRYDSLSCVGRSICKTPFLDELASRGVRFDNAYSVCALCSPARASMLTGLYPHNHRMTRNNDWPDPQEVVRDLPGHIGLISQYLIEAGYNCGYSGKWHCGHKKVPSTYGFVGMDVPDYGNPYKTREYTLYISSRGLERPRIISSERKGPVEVGTLSESAEACEPHFVAEFAIGLMEKFGREWERDGKPFMLFVSFWGPHHPYLVPEPYASMYNPEDIELWPNFHDKLVDKPYVQKRFLETWGEPDEEIWRKAIAKYWGFCTFIDAEVGRLLNALREMNLENDTAVIFSTDHGDMTGSHGGFWDKGPFMYEETYHIPMIIYWPGKSSGGRKCNKLVSNMDLAATVLDIAGAPLPENLDGRSLVPLLHDPDADWPDDLMCEFHGHRFPYPQRMLRWGHYKYIFNVGDHDELYDLEADPYEMVNLINDQAMISVVKECRRRLLKWIRKTEDSSIAYAAQCMLSDS